MKLGARVHNPLPHAHRLVHGPRAHAGPVSVGVKGASASVGPVRVHTQRTQSRGGESAGAFGALVVVLLVIGVVGAAIAGVLLFVWRWVLTWPHTLVSDVWHGPAWLGWGLTIAGWAVLGYFVIATSVHATGIEREARAKRAAENTAGEAAMPAEAVDVDEVEPDPEPAPEPEPVVSVLAGYEADVATYHRWASRGRQRR